METRATTRARCEDAWRQGMPLKETSDGFPIVMKPSQNCERRVKGTHDIAYVGLPKTKEEIAEFLATIPRLTSDDLDTAPEGPYTWLLYSKGDGVPQFAASETETMLELGTTHYAIATSVGATRVHGAGELWKHGTQLTFNFLSGTFMQSWLLPKECPLKAMEQFIRIKLQQEVLPDLFRGKTLTFSDETFVAPRFIRQGLTTEKLETYVRYGFTVCIHDERNKAECKSTKAACKKPMERVEEMKGGVPPTPRRPARQGSENLTQFAEAKRMLQFGQVARPEPTAPAPVPVSRIEGMGGRKKTKKTKKARRKTRRGGKHIGEKMAEDLVGPETPVPPTIRNATLLGVVRRLKIKAYPQIQYLYENAEDISPMLKPAELDAHMKKKFNL